MNWSRQLKNFLHSPACPDFLFDLYFKRKLDKDRQRLAQRLENPKSLMEQLKPKQREHWTPRIDDVIRCTDNTAISRHQQAGQIVDGLLVMHNGIKIDPLSYYDLPMLSMLMQNKGVHEPQEEKIFQEVLHSLDRNRSLCMLELGAYWSFYSMWCQQIHPDAQCYMVEPDRRNLYYGKENFRLNGSKGTFLHGGIGKAVDLAANILTVDHICETQGIDFIDILHTDIQGYELEMLEGAKKLLSQQKVGYLFISTHSDELHRDCRQVLEKQYHYQLVSSADLQETFSWDGILVMKHPGYPGIKQVSISKKTAIV